MKEVVEGRGIVIGYSNDLGMEVNINCTDPSGKPMVRLSDTLFFYKYAMAQGLLGRTVRTQSTLHDWLAD